MRTVMAGEVLTKPLLKRIDKAAYQYGGLKVEGVHGLIKKDGKAEFVKATAYLSRNHIKGNPDIFLRDFQKTMNSLIFNLTITP